jgi:hypothetical protein
MVLVLAGCATKPEQPDWIAGNSAKYPDAQFLIGRGQADTPGQARDRARADLAKVFQVAVDEVSVDVTSYTRSESGTSTQSGLEAQATRTVRATTAQVVKGVVIAEQWQAEAGDDHHALAALERAPAMNRLRAEIRTLDDATEAAIAAARASGDLIGQIGGAQRAVSTQFDRLAEQRVLRIVDPSGVGEPPRYDLGQLIKDRDTLLARVKLTSTITSDSLGGLAELVPAAIANAGFTPTTTGQATHDLNTGFEHTAFRDAQGWYWLRGALTITLLSKTSGQALGNHTWPIKVSARDNGTAVLRARAAQREALNRDLRGVVIGFGQTD